MSGIVVLLAHRHEPLHPERFELRLGKRLALGPDRLVLPGHTSEPVAFDGEPICAPLSEVQKIVRVLREDEEVFVEEIAGRVAPTPSNFERIVELNRARPSSLRWRRSSPSGRRGSW